LRRGDGGGVVAGQLDVLPVGECGGQCLGGGVVAVVGAGQDKGRDPDPGQFAGFVAEVAR
jgi:hypothetical protein